MTRRAFLAALVAAPLAACAVSKHHLGFHNLDDGRRPYSMVGNRYVKELSAEEARWVLTIAKGDFDALMPYVAPKLAAKLTPEVRKKASDRVRRWYVLTGNYDIRTFGVPPVSLSKVVRKDAFDYYDMIGTAFTLEGKVPATLLLYVTKLDGRTKVCGFEIFAEQEGERELGRDIRYVVPETIDRSSYALTIPLPEEATR